VARIQLFGIRGLKKALHAKEFQIIRGFGVLEAPRIKKYLNITIQNWPMAVFSLTNIISSKHLLLK